ncbi:MAG: DUF4175 family protein [Gemmatimonadota bacterium]
MGLILDYIAGERPSPRERLMKVIRSVRRRWRLKMAIRGAAIVIGVSFATFLISAFGMDFLRFNPTAVIVFRVLSYAIAAGLFVRFLVIPLWQRVPDERVALYLEEHEPSLKSGLLSAVEFGHLSEDESALGSSPALVRLTVEAAIERCSEIDYGRRVERKSLARSTGLLAGTTLAALAVILLAPPFLRTGGSFLLFPLSRTSAESPYSITVLPGDARVARGADLKVAARLNNFDASQVAISVRRGEQVEWESWTMNLDDETGDYLFFLFDLDENTEYMVEASGVRSSVFNIEVSDLPYVQQLDLEYHFPAYTGLTPRVQEDGGDIAALEGTEVRLRVTPTLAVAGGAIVIEERDSIALALAEDGTLRGSLRVEREGMYKIVFESLDGAVVSGSPDFLIDVLTDQPPYIAFIKPGRDIKATAIEEVFTEVEAEDDYGLRKLELVYSVNGGPEETIELYGGARSLKRVTAGHTFYLEEIELLPGDFLSYYARTVDGNRVDGPQRATTDIYFVEIRPFDREFRQAEQAGAAGAATFNSSLSQQQRMIIAATFKMIRDREEYAKSEYEENLATLALAQGRLRQQVETLVRRIQTRGIAQADSSFRTIAKALPIAMREMEAAEEQLGRRDPKEALPPEQRALQQLQRAESVFREFQVGQGGGQPSGGGAQPNADELADLFELELDRMRNQYERVERAQREEVDNAIDETLQKLQELARRQQQENERLRARGDRSQGGSGGSSGNQRQLAEEAEELARRLERLAREQSLPELAETARELRRAAEAMRRSASSSNEESVARGLSALQRLREARRLLDQNRSARLGREIDDVLERSRRLAREQRGVEEDVENLDGAGANRDERVRQLVERKEEMAAEVADMEAQLDRLAREARGEQRDASRKLQEAANSIRDNKLEDMIRYSRGVVQQRSPDYARNFEQQIGSNIDQLTEKIEEARGAMGETREQRIARSLERTRELVESLQSLDERIEERGQAEGDQRQEGEQQEGQAGQQQGGQQQGDGERRATDPNGPGGLPNFRSGDIRQFQREFRERRAEAEELRDALRREGVATPDLDVAIDRLRELERRRIYGDPKGLDELQEQVIRGLKEFEYALRRQIDQDDDRELLLTGSDEVPEGYRELVEKYYKSLAGESQR